MFQRPVPRLRRLPTASELFEARFKRFARELKRYEQHVSFERTLDAFLDLYSNWKKTHAKPIKIRLVMLAFELHRLNPEFRCDLSFKDSSSCGKSSSEI